MVKKIGEGKKPKKKSKKKVDLKQFGENLKKAMDNINQASKKLDEDLKKALGEYY